MDHWLADEPVTAYREPLTVRLRRWGRRNRVTVAAAAALVLTATAALAVGLVVVNAEKNLTADARDDERRAKEAEQKANADLTAALARETKLKGDLETANAGLKTALARETKLKDESRRLEKSAAEQRKLALETMEDVVNVLDERLKSVPALKEFRKELLERAKKGLQQVSREGDTIGRIDHGTIWVHLKLGDISLEMDGDTRWAWAQYELAHRLAKKRADAEPTDTQAQRDLSVAHEKQGNVRLQMGDPEAALASYQASFAIAANLVSLDLSNVERQRDLSVGHQKLGDVQLKLRNYNSALQAYKASLGIRKKLSDIDPSNVERQRDLSVAHQRLGLCM